MATLHERGSTVSEASDGVESADAPPPRRRRRPMTGGRRVRRWILRVLLVAVVVFAVYVAW